MNGTTELKNLVEAAHTELLVAIGLGPTNWDDVYEWTEEDYYNRLETCYNDMNMAEMVYEYVQRRYFKREV